MEGWKTVAVAVAGAGVGLVAEKSLTLPISSGSTFWDQVVDVGIGVAGVYVSVKYIDHAEIGVACAGAGAGWALGGVANILGVSV